MNTIQYNYCRMMFHFCNLRKRHLVGVVIKLFFLIQFSSLVKAPVTSMSVDRQDDHDGTWKEYYFQYRGLLYLHISFPPFPTIP